MRILDITTFYSSQSGGVRTYLDAKALQMARHGVSHALVVPGERAGTEIRDGSRVHRVAGPEIPFAPGYRLLTSVAAVADILEREQPDIVEVGSPWVVPVVVRRAMARVGQAVPTVGFYHSDLIRTYAEPYVERGSLAPVRVAARVVARKWVRAVYSRFDITVAASDAVAAELRRLGVAPVETIGLGVDLEVFRPRSGAARWLRATLGVPASKPVALFAGRFAAEKRLDVVLEGHQRLPRYDRPHLLFVGQGAWRDRLEATARGRGDITVLPYIDDREELARLYAGSDLYLASGPGETFGLSIGEALAAGLPVLCVDSGAAPDRVRGSGVAELYQHGDPGSCGEALQTLCRRLGPGLRVRARNHAERTFSWQKTFDTLVRLYGELLHRGVEGRRVA